MSRTRAHLYTRSLTCTHVHAHARAFTRTERTFTCMLAVTLQTHALTRTCVHTLATTHLHMPMLAHTSTNSSTSIHTQLYTQSHTQRSHTHTLHSQLRHTKTLRVGSEYKMVLVTEICLDQPGWWQEFEVGGEWKTAPGVRVSQAHAPLPSPAPKCLQNALGNQTPPPPPKGALMPCSCSASRGWAGSALGQLPNAHGDRQTLTRFLSLLHIRTNELQTSGLRK